MSAPLGNKYALGNKGGGRKSAYQERADAQILMDIWEGRYSPSQLQEILKSKKYGAKHIFASLCLTQNERALMKLMDKLFPNKQSQEINFGKDNEIDEAISKIQELISYGKPNTQNYRNPFQDRWEALSNPPEVYPVVQFNYPKGISQK